jgi:leucyl/phenylalanyl-tRNA--protein transferase
VGGSLHPELLLDAYRHGIFPWPTSDDEPLYWFSPDPRAVIEFDEFYISRRLRRRLASGRYHGTCNQAFRQVMTECSRGPGRLGGTWITPQMIRAYNWMHQLGHAHSIEVWEGEQLVGGVYGVAVGSNFAAESMFHRVTDGSKMALAYLVAHLRARRFTLLDIQQWTEHTGSLGARELARNTYLLRLASGVNSPVRFGSVLAGNPLNIP